MKPEASSAGPKPESPKSESHESKVDEVKSETEEEKGLTDEEKVVMNLLIDNSPVDLNDLKAQAGLSNKKWDKAIKGLTKNKLAKVEKNDDGLFVSVI
jgi:uncharacterized membrane protein